MGNRKRVQGQSQSRLLPDLDNLMTNAVPVLFPGRAKMRLILRMLATGGFSLWLFGCSDAVDQNSSIGAGVFAPAGRDGGGVNSQSLERMSASTKLPSNAYRVGPQDFLDINVFNVPALSRQMQVSGDGTINVPMIGEVHAAGKTAQELERELTVRLGGRYLQNPQVSLSIKEYNSQRFTVEGAVKRAGIFPIKNEATLMQGLSAAEGLDKDTASSSVIIFRTENGQRMAARFDIDAIRAGTTPDPAIQNGDLIVVGTSTGKVAFQNFTKLLPAAGLFRPF